MSLDSPPGSYQPFECPLCQSRFTRHENLKRHTALHSQISTEKSFPCEFCPVAFSRRDLRVRHVKRKHPELERRTARAVLPLLRRDSRGHAEDGGRTRHERLGLEGMKLAERDRNEGVEGMDEDEGMDLNGMLWQIEMPLDRDQLRRNAELRPHFQSPETSMTGSESSNAGNGGSIVASWSTEQAACESTLDARFGAGQQTTHYEETSSRGAAGINSSHQSDHRSSSTIHPQKSYSETLSDQGSPYQTMAEDLSPIDRQYLLNDWFPSATQAIRGYQLYFDHVSHFVPFIHRATFDATETPPHLGLSMLCLAYQHGEDPACGNRLNSGRDLSLRCFHRARVLAASVEEIADDDLTHSIILVQTYWLLQICAMMFLCGKYSTYGLKIHSKMISLARFGGLTQASSTISTTTDLESLWRDFIKAESQKRTILAIHQIDALWYQLFSIPRLLSHLEIKHDLPCAENCWSASSSTQWAYQRLAPRQSTHSMRYVDAVRCFLSPDPEVHSLPIFDPYGALNVTQFLLSSVREISGWSTMTGRLSLERIEPLRSSLLALEPFIRPQVRTVGCTQAASCEATWEMAMIELQMWSLLHTCGIVEGSVDAFLRQSTQLTSSYETMCGTENASAIQPHLDWFLSYLNAPQDREFDPPWISLYAYKAFLIAWSLLRKGAPGVMRVIGIEDVDVDGAVTWAKRVFERRQDRPVVTLIASCLDMLFE